MEKLFQQCTDTDALELEAIKIKIKAKLYTIISQVENGKSIEHLQQFNEDLRMTMLLAEEVCSHCKK